MNVSHNQASFTHVANLGGSFNLNLVAAKHARASFLL